MTLTSLAVSLDLKSLLYVTFPLPSTSKGDFEESGEAEIANECHSTWLKYT